jgi:xanthine dehydrogenase/oxidase
LFLFSHKTEKERNRPYDRSAIESNYSSIPKFSVTGFRSDQPAKSLVGKAIHHQSAVQQTTGEVFYADDLPAFPRELYAAFIMSTIPHGNILEIDFSKAKSYTGVVDIITAKDARGEKFTGSHRDEPVFAEKEVCYIGQPVGLVLAETNEIASKASKLVEIKYEELQSVLSIQQAIKENSFLEGSYQLLKEDLSEFYSKSNHIVECEFSVGGKVIFILKLKQLELSFLKEINFGPQLQLKIQQTPKWKLLGLMKFQLIKLMFM